MLDVSIPFVTTDASFSLNLPAYFDRIGFAGEAPTKLSTLRALHRAHATTIPFENLDVFLRCQIRLDLPSLEAKLVTARRGGYCFEQNGLFSAVLESLGFAVTRLAARVHRGTNRINPRTHMLLLVETEAGPHIADVGFGGWGLLEPIPFVAGKDFRQGTWTFRLDEQPGASWILLCPACPVGPEQYSFTLAPQLPIDYEPANHYCATHPDSRFVQTLTVQLPSLDRRVFLRNREFVTVTREETKTELLADDLEVIAVLERHFGLRLPADASFGLTGTGGATSTSP
jgi:N-hydroxyarylamine O-acetyltransferase